MSRTGGKGAGRATRAGGTAASRRTTGSARAGRARGTGDQGKPGGPRRPRSASGGDTGGTRGTGGMGRAGGGSIGLANPRHRVRAMFLSVLFVFTLFAAQLVRLQGIDAAEVAEQARDLRTGSPSVLPAERGRMLDRDGVVLAGSVERRDIVADQVNIAEYEVRDPQTKKTTTVGAAGAARELAPLLDMDEAELREKLTGESRWVQLARKLEPAQWRKIEALRIPGIASELAEVRTYPGGAPVAPVLGWVGADGQAVDGSGAGLELLHNEKLQGTPGRAQREYSADGRAIPMGFSEITPAVPGSDLKLTLDNDLSWYAFNAIADRVKESEADSGTVVVMDVKGRLRAVTQFPSFDPVTRSAKGTEYSALPFQQVFEPGSTAKVMSIGAALDLGAITPTSAFTVPNRLERADRNFRDSHDHKTLQLTTAGVMAQSSNIGTLLAGEKVDPAALEKYFRSFGLGQRSGVGFPGESSGLIKPWDEWDASQRYTVMFGQGLSITAIQDAGVFQTIANGGVRVPPTVVESITGPDGSVTPQPLPEGTRVLKEQTATDLSVMLESVVGTSGTAQQAAIAGIPVAGKTGTAERYDPEVGGYSGYTASFIGFAPADKPELIVAVILQNPKKGGYYGGTTAGPVFQQVMSYALQKYGIPPTGLQRTPFPLEVGQTLSEDIEKVDPSVIPPAGPMRVGAGTPTAPRVAEGTSVPSRSPSPSSSRSFAAKKDSTRSGRTASAASSAGSRAATRGSATAPAAPRPPSARTEGAESEPGGGGTSDGAAR